MSDKAINLTVGTFVVGILLFAIWAAVKENQAWEQFRVDHKCKITRQERGGTASWSGYDGKGNYVTGTERKPDRTTWYCDDGVEYVR